jgi:hypothetical protein
LRLPYGEERRFWLSKYLKTNRVTDRFSLREKDRMRADPNDYFILGASGKFSVVWISSNFFAISIEKKSL